MAPTPLGARHPEVDRLRRLVRSASDRRAERAFVVEGIKLVGDAFDAGADIEAVYVAGIDGQHEAIEQRARDAGVPIRVLAPGVLERVANTVTPQPVMAVVDALDVSLPEIATATFVVVCVDVQDPGNAGTVLRSAEAAGAGAVVFAGASVDPYNPKAVRASAGSLFHVPLVRGGDPVDVLEQLGASGLRRLGTTARTGEPLDRCDLTTPTALVLGNEAHGLPPATAVQLDGEVTIPMVGRTESLNVGMAAAVLCFEVARQRRATGAHGG